jgi:hypothetical protein
MILSHAEHTRNRFHRMLSIRGTNFRACSASGKMWTFLHVQSMLSIRGTNFIAHWAYGELISSHAEHTGNRFHRMLSMRGNVWKSNISAESNTIFKNLVLQALGTIRIRFLQKKYLKKFHACVPLRKPGTNLPSFSYLYLHTCIACMLSWPEMFEIFFVLASWKNV